MLHAAFAGNGSSVQYAYDLQHRLTEIQNAATASPLTLVSRYNYTYDKGAGPDGKAMKGMISSVTERFKSTDQNLSGPYTTSYGYDPLYQLTSAAYPTFDSSLNIPWSGQTHSWTYDAIGNRLTYTKTGAGTPDVATYAYNLSNKGPQLLGVTHTGGEPSVTFQYDSNGNTATQTVTGGATTTYTWDQDDKMTGLTTSDSSNTAAYTYSYNGDRLQRTLNNVTWKYLYSKEDILKVDQGGANPMYLTQGPGIDDVLAEAVGSNVNYGYKNMLSSVLQLASSTGNVNNNYNYDAWGQATNWPTPGTDNNPYGYTGREWDGVGSYYARQRTLWPSLARFGSKDDSAKLSNLDAYKYVRDPIEQVDSLGQFARTVVEGQQFEPYRNLPTLCQGRSGCTAWEIKVDCPCTCKEGHYQMDITMTERYFVFVADDYASPWGDTSSDILFHENLHKRDYMRLGDEFAYSMKYAERIPYPTKGLCDTACEAWKLELKADIQLTYWWSNFWVHGVRTGWNHW